MHAIQLELHKNEKKKQIEVIVSLYGRNTYSVDKKNNQEKVNNSLSFCFTAIKNEQELAKSRIQEIL